MFSLSWDIEELKYLNDECCKMCSEIVERTNACSSEMFQLQQCSMEADTDQEEV